MKKQKQANKTIHNKDPNCYSYNMYKTCFKNGNNLNEMHGIYSLTPPYFHGVGCVAFQYEKNEVQKTTPV